MFVTKKKFKKLIEELKSNVDTAWKNDVELAKRWDAADSDLGALSSDVSMLLRIKDNVKDRLSALTTGHLRIEERFNQWIWQLESDLDSSRAKGANFIETFWPKVERLETRISLLESQNETLTALCTKLASTMRDEGAEAIREAVLATHFHYAEGLEVGAAYWLKVENPFPTFKSFLHRDRDRVGTPKIAAVSGTWDGIVFTKLDGGIVRHGSVEQVIKRVEIPDLS